MPLFRLNDLGMPGLERGIRLGTFAQQDDPLDHVIVVEHGAVFFTMAFPSWPRRTLGACTTVATSAREPEFRSAPSLRWRRYHRWLPSIPPAADVQGLLSAFDETAARIGVVGRQRCSTWLSDRP